MTSTLVTCDASAALLPLPQRLQSSFKDEALGTSNARASLHKDLKSRRQSLTVKEFQFLESLAAGGDDISIECARKKLQDGEVFFDSPGGDQVDQNTVQYEKAHTNTGARGTLDPSLEKSAPQCRDAPLGATQRFPQRTMSVPTVSARQIHLARRSGSQVHRSLWKAHEKGISTNSIVSSTRSVPFPTKLEPCELLSERRKIVIEHNRPHTKRDTKPLMEWGEDVLKPINQTITGSSTDIAASLSTLPSVSDAFLSALNNIDLKRQITEETVPSLPEEQGDTQKVSSKKIFSTCESNQRHGDLVDHPRDDNEGPKQGRGDDDQTISTDIPRILCGLPAKRPSDLTFVSVETGAGRRVSFMRSSDLLSDDQMMRNLPRDNNGSQLGSTSRRFSATRRGSSASGSSRPRKRMSGMSTARTQSAVSRRSSLVRIKAAQQAARRNSRRLLDVRRASVNAYLGEGFELLDPNASYEPVSIDRRVESNRSATERSYSLRMCPSHLSVASSFDDAVSSATFARRHSSMRLIDNEEDFGVLSDGEDKVEPKWAAQEGGGVDFAWHIGDDDSVACTAYGGAVSFLILGTSGDDESAQPHVLSPPLMDSLLYFFPHGAVESNFWLKFSMVRDGQSLHTLLQNVRGSKYCIIAVETMKGEVFGSFTSTPWRKNKNYYGNGESFLWRMKRPRSTTCRSALDQARLESELEVYPWTGENYMVQSCTNDRLVVGGGTLRGPSVQEDVRDDTTETHFGGFGFAIESDLTRGTTNSSATFANPPLSRMGSSFDVLNLEVWTMTPFINVEEANAMEMMHLFLENNRNN